MAFTNEEIAFISKAKKQTTQFFPEEFDTSKKENLVQIMNTYRAKGLLMRRRADQGKEADMWTEIRSKLGKPTKTQKQIIKEHASAQAVGMLEKTMDAHDARIQTLLKQLTSARANKKRSINKIEKEVKHEMRKLEKAQKEKAKRLQVVKDASKQVALNYKQAEDKLIEEEEREGKTVRKCWKCGEWYPVKGGVWTKHMKSCIVDKEEKEEKK